jgi:uncharacterized protein (DUF58 family)
VALAGLWLSVITGSAIGLAGVLAILYIAFDLRTPLPNDREAALSVGRICYKKVLMKVPVLMEVVVENRGAPIDRILLKDLPPGKTEVVRGSNSLLCGIPGSGKVVIRYEIVFNEPGTYQFDSISVKVQSMFGLVEHNFSLPSKASVRVYPRHLTKGAKGKPAKVFGWSGITPSRFKGGRLDFVDIREYRAGDPLKDVNWKASGRSGKTLVNEWNVEKGLDCIIVVDLSSESVPSVRDWSAKSGVVTAAYELASSLTGAGNRVGMLILGNILRRAKPGFGTRQLSLMVESLVDAQVGMIWGAEHTESFLEMFFRKQYKTRGGTLFFVFAQPSARLLDSLTTLSKKGFACNSIFVDVLSEEEQALIRYGILKGGDADFGMRYARAEVDYSIRALTQVSNAFHWRAGRGFRPVEVVQRA